MNIKKYPLLVALVFYWLFTITLFFVAQMNIPGHFGYPIDDTYIHMAMAKHFVKDGFWGVSQLGFSSSTSSPMWTFLIALAYKAVGINDWLPLVMNFLMGSIIIICSYYIFQKNTQPLRLTLFLIAIVLLIPLPVLTLTGMEHTLQTLLSILFGYITMKYLMRDTLNSQDTLLLMLLAGMLTMTRYEGMFLIASAMLLFCTQKRFLTAALIGGAGFFSILIYGLYALSQGWGFFPNSILLKGNLPSFSMEGISSFLAVIPYQLRTNPHILTLLIAILITHLCCEYGKTTGRRERYLLSLFLLSAVLHLQFAQTGWFYRYETYLVASGLIVLIHMINSLLSATPSNVPGDKVFTGSLVLILILLLTSPLASRAGAAYNEYPIAVTNIYEQQYQMGLFLSRYYSDEAIAANDIGAINYLADIKTLDLYGLASMEVLRAKQDGSYDQDTIKNLVASGNVKVIIIYDSWLEGNIPPDWVAVGQWKIINNFVYGHDTVTFYAPNQLLAQELTTNLQAFHLALPPTVIQSGIYISGK